MIIVTKSKLRQLLKKGEDANSVLHIRRDVHPDGSYYEYTYSGPTEEVEALSDRALTVDMEKVDNLLRAGHSFNEALKALGK